MVVLKETSNIRKGFSSAMFDYRRVPGEAWDLHGISMGFLWDI